VSTLWFGAYAFTVVGWQRFMFRKQLRNMNIRQ